MTSEGLVGEMFEGDYADAYAGKFPLVSMGGLRAQTRERGPPSALAEMRYFSFFLLFFLPPLFKTPEVSENC